MPRIDPSKAAELRKDIGAAVKYNRKLSEGNTNPEVCPGHFGAGTGDACCICSGAR